MADDMVLMLSGEDGNISPSTRAAAKAHLKAGGTLTLAVAGKRGEVRRLNADELIRRGLEKTFAEHPHLADILVQQGSEACMAEIRAILLAEKVEPTW